MRASVDSSWGWGLQVQQPESQSYSLYGAIKFDKEDAQRLEGMLRQTLGDDVSITYALELKNGTVYSSSDIADLDTFPFHERGRILKFSIKGDVNRRSVRITLYDASPISLPVATVWVWRVENIYSVAETYRSYIRGLRTWYSPGFIANDWMAILIVSPMFAAYSIVAGILKLNVRLEASIGLSSLAVFVAFLLVKRVVFTREAMLFGVERNRQEGLAKFRKWFFGGVVVGVIGLGVSIWLKKLKLI